MTAPAVIPPFAVVIPSWQGEVEKLVEALSRQSAPPAQIEVVRHVRPNGRARNLGVAGTRAPYLVFWDDDALPGHAHVLENLLLPFVLGRYRGLGVTGASRVTPTRASRFQHRLAREIPRVENLIVAEDTETNPALSGYVFSEVTTTCCAMPRALFDAVGGFDEVLENGIDTDFFHRVRELGARFFLIGGTFVEHEPPATVRALVRKYYRYGVGHGALAARHPEWKIGLFLPGRLAGALYLAARACYLLPNVFLPYSQAYRHFEFAFKPWKALASFASALGYVRGYFASPQAPTSSPVLAPSTDAFATRHDHAPADPLPPSVSRSR